MTNVISRISFLLILAETSLLFASIPVDPFRCTSGLNEGTICDLQLSGTTVDVYYCEQAVCTKNIQKNEYEFFAEHTFPNEKSLTTNDYFFSHNASGPAIPGTIANPIIPFAIIRPNCDYVGRGINRANFEENTDIYAILDALEEYFSEASYGRYTPETIILNDDLDGLLYPTNLIDCFRDEPCVAAGGGNCPNSPVGCTRCYKNDPAPCFSTKNTIWGDPQKPPLLCEDNPPVSPNEICYTCSWDPTNEISYEMLPDDDCEKDHFGRALIEYLTGKSVRTNLSRMATYSKDTSGDGLEDIYYIPTTIMLYKTSGMAQGSEYATVEVFDENNRSIKVITRLAKISMGHDMRTYLEEYLHCRGLFDLYTSSRQWGRLGSFDAISGGACVTTASTLYAESCASDMNLIHKMMLGWVPTTGYTDYFAYISIVYDGPQILFYKNGVDITSHNECKDIENAFCFTLEFEYDPADIIHKGGYFIIGGQSSDYQPFLTGSNTLEIKSDTAIIGQILHLKQLAGQHVGNRVNYSKWIPAWSYGIDNNDGLLLHLYNKNGRSDIDWAANPMVLLPYLDIIEQDPFDTKADIYAIVADRARQLGISAADISAFIDNNMATVVPRGIYPWVWDHVLQDWIDNTQVDTGSFAEISQMMVKTSHENWPSKDSFPGMYFRFNANDRLDSVSSVEYRVNVLGGTGNYSLPRNTLRVYPSGNMAKAQAVSIINLKESNGIYSMKLLFSSESDIAASEKAKLTGMINNDFDADGICDHECVPDSSGLWCAYDFAEANVNPMVNNHLNDYFDNTPVSVYGLDAFNGYSAKPYCLLRDGNTDNCPRSYNPGQADWNGNGIGDACEDSDGDGVADASDNCRTTPNPLVFADENTELIMGVDYTKTGAPYFPVDGGAYFYGFTRTYFSFFPFRWGFKWQPDHNLNGVGDACDPGHAYSFVRNATPVHSNRLYSFTGNFNDYVQIDPRLLANAASKYATMHYCAINDRQAALGYWGKDGYCATAHGSETKYDDTNRPRPYFNFGFSHGTDEMSIDEQGRSPWDMHISWARNITELKKDFLGDANYSGDDARPAINISNLFFVNNKIYWNWRRDWWEKNDCHLKSGNVQCEALKHPTNGKQVANNVHYTLSSGVYPELANPVNKNPYITEIEGTKTINYAYFKNQKKYARSSRYSLEKGTLNYYTRQLPKPDTHMADLVLTTCHHCHLVVPESAITAEEEDRWFDYGLWSLVKQEDTLVFSAERKFAVEEMRFFVEGAERALYAVSRAEDGDYFMTSYPDSGPDWHRMGAVDNWPTTLQIAAALADGDRFFIMGKANDAEEEHLYALVAQQTGTAPFGEEEIPLFRFVFEDRGATGLDNYSGKYLIAVGSSRYLLSRAGGVTTLHLFDTLTGQFTLLAPAVSPSARKVYNVYGTEDKLYLVGGIDMNDGTPKDLWAFDTATNEWTKLHDNLTGDLRKLIIELIDGKIVMASPVLEFHQMTHSAIALDPTGNSISYPTVPVTESPDYLLDLIEGYCLNENGTLLKGGTMISGSCTPFTHPWYKSFSIGTTVYSVAGKGDRLYVGTGSAIKVYDISDPNALLLKSTFTTNRRVYDLEVVEGDIMYAATSGGIYKFNTANPDALNQLSFYGTPYNYQYRIQLYNDKLYVGDDNGINIRHKDTFARLAYVNLGSVVDFAITNGELALYWYAFWDEGIMTRDADSLTLKAYEYGYCSTGELTTDHGAFYLACDGYEYRFAGRPDTYIDFWELNGDMREMAENHLYNGWVYIPDGSAVKVSTNNEVPSYCGNGIVEPGEVCDGDSVYCEDLDPNEWNSGTATCNSTCSGWNTGNCYWSGC